jgi:rare lipoprotein A
MKDLWEQKQIIKRPLLKLVVILAISFFMFPKATRGVCFAQEIIGYASWYSIESCKREGTSGIMANGKELKDEDYTCAIWGQKFGTIFKVTNLKTGVSVQVVVTDRGPAKRLVKKGHIIDLSKMAFSRIAKLERGIVEVKIETIKLERR